MKCLNIRVNVWCFFTIRSSDLLTLPSKHSTLYCLPMYLNTLSAVFTVQPSLLIELCQLHRTSLHFCNCHFCTYHSLHTPLLVLLHHFLWMCNISMLARHLPDVCVHILFNFNISIFHLIFSILYCYTFNFMIPMPRDFCFLSCPMDFLEMFTHNFEKLLKCVNFLKKMTHFSQNTYTYLWKCY